MVLKPDAKVVALAGGVGGAKLVYGLAQILTPEQLTIIGNVADDFELYGLHISPDLDTVMYTLAGVANPATGWGLVDETQHMLAMMRQYGETPWFMLGDKDLATHLLRTEWLKQGVALTTITGRLTAGLGVQHRLLPVTDDPVRTMVETEEHGTLAFQAYFVRHRWEPTVRRIWFDGVETARVSAPVAEALDTADVIVFCPSNPFLSIEPILAIPGVRGRIQNRRGISVAISPIIGGRAVKGPAAKLMVEQQMEPTPRSLIEYYRGLLDGLVVDVLDRDHVSEDEMVSVLVTETLMKTDADKKRLAGEVIEWVEKTLS